MTAWTLPPPARFPVRAACPAASSSKAARVGDPKRLQMSDDRRSTPRWRYLDFVIYHAKSVRGEGHLANVSDTGVFVRTDLFPQVGEAVELILQGTDGDPNTTHLHGTVRWIGRRHDGAEGFGAELIDPPEAYLTMLRSLSATGRPDGRPQRLAPRLELSIPVAVEFGTRCDDGTLSDISLTGARLEKTALCPAVGSQVTLMFAIRSGRPFEIVARVVRVTETGGYAVQFEALDPAFKAALADATAVLSKLPDSSG
jgi:hypothetical protein